MYGPRHPWAAQQTDYTGFAQNSYGDIARNIGAAAFSQVVGAIPGMPQVLQSAAPVWAAAAAARPSQHHWSSEQQWPGALHSNYTSGAPMTRSPPRAPPPPAPQPQGTVARAQPPPQQQRRSRRSQMFEMVISVFEKVLSELRIGSAPRAIEAPRPPPRGPARAPQPPQHIAVHQPRSAGAPAVVFHHAPDPPPQAPPPQWETVGTAWPSPEAHTTCPSAQNSPQHEHGLQRSARIPPVTENPPSSPQIFSSSSEESDQDTLTIPHTFVRGATAPATAAAFCAKCPTCGHPQESKVKPS